MTKFCKKPTRALATRPKLNKANELLSELGKMHRQFIFPALFKRLTFDMVCEVEYDCEVCDGRFRVMRTNCWLAPGRPDKARLPTICFPKEQACSLGAIFDDEIKQTIGLQNKRFSIGYTKDPTYVEKQNRRVIVVGEVEHQP